MGRSPSRIARIGVLLTSLLAPATAGAATLVIADAEAPLEARLEADAVGFLLRHAVHSPLRIVSSPARLRDALFRAGRPGGRWRSRPRRRVGCWPSSPPTAWSCGRCR